MKNQFFFRKVFLFSLCLYTVSIILVYIDTKFIYRWYAFFLWISAIFLPFLFLFKTRLKEISSYFLNIKKTPKNFIPIIILFSVSGIASLVFLKTYPFVAVYDQVRDGGLHAQEIVDGTIKNIFGYGRYESHGLTIPVITSFFYRIFQNSVLTFRLPAAIISILDMFILYFLIRKTLNKEAAFWSALVLVTIPLHLYYARTEIVVIFSSILTSLIFLGISYFTKNKNYQMFSLLGLLLGFTSGFHASIRTVSLLTVIIVSVITFYDILIKKAKKKIALGFIFLIIFYFIGFGPRILFTTPEIFFKTGYFYFSSENNKDINFSTKIEKISQNYVKSLQVYFKEPTISTHYPDFKPLLTPILGILFLIGFIYSLLSKKIFLRIICIYALILPLTNSAITEIVNADNRLTPLLPVSAIFTGVGIYFIFSKIDKKLKIFKLVPKFLLSIYILMIGFNFFLNESATKLYTYYDYFNMHIIYDLKADQSFKEVNNICFYISKDYYDYLSPWYMLNRTQEQFEYFVPNKYFFIFQNNNVQNNQAYVSKSCNQNLEEMTFAKITHCSENTKFLCPKDVRMPFNVYVESSIEKTYQDPNEFLNTTPPPLLIPPIPVYIP